MRGILVIMLTCICIGAAQVDSDLVQAQSNADTININDLKRSVGRLTYFDGEGGTATGTGFVVDNVLGAQKVIVTTAHLASRSIEKGQYFLWLYGSPKKVTCKPLAWNRQVDLLVLLPQNMPNVPGLKLSSSEPTLQSQVVILGAACGLEISQHAGLIHADPTPAAEIMDSLRRAIDVNSPLSPKTRVVRHNASSCKGFSGAPILDDQGRVLAVQHGGIAGADENFAIAISHLKDLTHPGADRSATDGGASRTAGIQQHSAFKPLTSDNVAIQISRGRLEVEIDFMLAEKVGFDRRLDETVLLEAKRVGLESSPQWISLPKEIADWKRNVATSDALGITLFTPSTYRIKIEELERAGCKLTFAENLSEAFKPNELPVSVMAFWLEDHYELDADRAYLNEILASDQILTKLIQSDIGRRFHSRARYGAAHITETLLEESVAHWQSEHQQIASRVTQGQVPSPPGVTAFAALFELRNGSTLEIRSMTSGRTGVVSIRTCADQQNLSAAERDARLVQACVLLN